MTVFRVDVEKDVVKVVKDLKDAEIDKATAAWNKSSEAFMDGWLTALKTSRDAVADARKLYTLCDERLKDKSLDATKRKTVLQVRKYAHSFTENVKQAKLL